MSPKPDFGNTSFERVVRGDMFGRRVAKNEKLRHVKVSCLHTDLLFQHAQDTENHADPATKEALRYRTALNQGFRSLTERPLSTNTAVEICRTLKGAQRRQPTGAAQTLLRVTSQHPEALRDLQAI
jgi:hypothetical protein